MFFRLACSTMNHGICWPGMDPSGGAAYGGQVGTSSNCLVALQWRNRSWNAASVGRGPRIETQPRCLVHYICFLFPSGSTFVLPWRSRTEGLWTHRAWGRDKITQRHHTVPYQKWNCCSSWARPGETSSGLGGMTSPPAPPRSARCAPPVSLASTRCSVVFRVCWGRGFAAAATRSHCRGRGALRWRGRRWWWRWGP